MKNRTFFKIYTQLFFSALVLLCLLGISPTQAQAQSANLDQCANGPASSPTPCGAPDSAGKQGYVNGNLNQ